MLQKVIDAIETELEKRKDDRMMRLIGDFVIKQCEQDPTACEAVEKALDDKKNIAGAISKMRDEAKKVASGNMGILTDEEGYANVKKYFGTEKDSQDQKSEKIVSIFDLM